MKLDDLRQSIRERRKYLSLSAESLANQAKTTKAIILNFENGKTGLTLDTLFRVFDVLGIEPILIYSVSVFGNMDKKG